MTAFRRCFLDTNVLLRTLVVRAPGYGLAADLIRLSGSRGIECCCSLQNLAEFWNVYTRSAVANGFGMSTVEADKHIRVIESDVSVLTEVASTLRIWRDLVCRYQVQGAQVHDARIVAVMLSHGVHSIITANTADFVRYREVEAIHPADRARLEAI